MIQEIFGGGSKQKVDEQKVSLSVRARGGQDYMDVKWFPDSEVLRTLITEARYNRLLKGCPNMKLYKNKVKFTPYTSK